jgi:hypothetical protein
MCYKLVGVNGIGLTATDLASNSKSPFAPLRFNNINLRGVGNIIDRGTGTVVLNSEYRHT